MNIPKRCYSRRKRSTCKNVCNLPFLIFVDDQFFFNCFNT